MTSVRIHRYSVEPADFEEFLERRANLINAIRAAHPDLIETRLTRLEDGTYTDVWRWKSAEQMSAAFADLPNFPEARLTLSLTTDATALNGEIIEER